MFFDLKQPPGQAALPALMDIFHTLDSDASGCITREEISHVPLDMLPPKLLETVSVDNMTDLFELLDVDGGGTLTQSEFVEGADSYFALRYSPRFACCNRPCHRI